MSFLLSHFQCGPFWFGVREGMLGIYCWLLWLVPVGVEPHSLGSPNWFKVFAGVAYSQPMWPHPWHLKHWRELGSLLFDVPSLDPCVFGPWPPVVVVPMPQPAAVLWAEAVCPRPVQPLWELGKPQVFLSIHPLPWHLSGDIWGTGKAVALSCSGQGSHQFGYLIPQLCSALYRFSGHG